MKEICKDYYKYSKNEIILALIVKSFNINWPERGKIAQHDNTPISVLIRLSEDKELGVRYRVVGNPNTPVYIIEKLKLRQESNETMRWRIAERLKVINNITC